MKTYDQLVAETAQLITEIMPWDLADKIAAGDKMLIVDVREADEFNVMHIPNTINIPRGILEAASESGYDETDPHLASARDQEVILVCRSGKRSCMAAYSLQLLGFNRATSLKTGLRGWNDFEQPLIDADDQTVDGDSAEEFLRPKPQAV